MRFAQLHLLAFLILLVGWTVALLVPIPRGVVKELGETNAFYVGKTIHVGVYAFLTLVGGALPLSHRARVILITVLLAHGWITEYFQQFVDRGSSVRDALLDMLGVAVGVALGWRYRWRELFVTPKRWQIPTSDDPPGTGDRQP